MDNKEKQNTNRKYYLSVRPSSAGFKKNDDSDLWDKTQTTSETNSAAYRENVGRFNSANHSPPFSNSAADSRPSSAGLAGLDQYDQDFKRI